MNPKQKTEPVTQSDLDQWIQWALIASRKAASIQRDFFRNPIIEADSKADGSPVTLADTQSEEIIREELRLQGSEFGVYGEEFGQEGELEDCWVIDPIDGTRNFVDGLPGFAILIGLRISGSPLLGVVHAPALGAMAGDPELMGWTWIGIADRGAWRGYGTHPQTAQKDAIRVRDCKALSATFLCHGGLSHIHESGKWDSWSKLTSSVRRTRGFGDWWGHCLVAEGAADAMYDPRVELHDTVAVEALVRGAGGVLLAREKVTRNYIGPTVSGSSEIAESIGICMEGTGMVPASNAEWNRD